MKTINRISSAATFLALAAALVAAAPALADDAYIESNGSQFINTGYYPSGKTKIEVDFQLTSTASSKDCVFGNYGSTFSVLLYANPGNTVFQCCGKDGGWQAAGTGVAIDTQRHTMVIDVPGRKGTMSAPDGTFQGQANFNGSWTFANTANWPITLFASCNSTDGTTVRQPVSAKIFGAKIWESEDGGATYSLLHDYSPAVKGSIAGLLDSVTGDFLYDTRATGGMFAYGGDIPEIDDDPCIISDGTAQTGINSGFFWGPLSRIEVEYAFDALSPYQMRLFGADGQTPRIAFYLNGSGNASFGFDTADHSAFSALTTAKTADTRRYVAVADQKTGKAYYILKTETGVVTNWSGNIPSTPAAAATLPIALFGNINAAPVSFKSTFKAGDNSAKARIYRAKFYEDDVLVRDLVPLVKAGIPGFRDQVSGDFVTVDRDAMLPAFSASPATPSEEDDAWILVSDYDLTATNYKTYIDTGYTATTETGVELDFAFDSDYPQSGWVGNNDWNFFGARNGSGDPRFTVYFNKGGFGYCYGASLWLSAESPNLARLSGDQNVRRTLVFDGHSKTLAFITAGYTNSAATLPAVDPVTFSTSLKLGGNEGGNATPPLRVYGFKISEGGVLQHDYVPKIKDGVAGLYDNIGGGFISAANKKISLKYGGTITGASARDDAAYLESDATQGVNLNYFMKPATRIEADFAFTDCTTNSTGTTGYQQRVFGQDSGGGLLSALYINGGGNFMFGYGNTFINNHGPSVAADTVRHTAVIDSYHDRLYWITGGVTNKTYDISGDAHLNTATWPSGVFATPNNQAATAWRNPSKMKLYSLRIYESDILVHEFVPYSDNGVPCLFDTVDKVVKTDARNGNAFVLGGMGVDGAEKWVKQLPATAQVSQSHQTFTLTAAAAGAIRYRWTLNGEEIEGATGETCTATWSKGRHDAPDVYACTAIYDVFGTETEGDPATCEVTNLPIAFVLIVR